MKKMYLYAKDKILTALNYGSYISFLALEIWLTTLVNKSQTKKKTF